MMSLLTWQVGAHFCSSIANGKYILRNTTWLVTANVKKQLLCFFCQTNETIRLYCAKDEPFRVILLNGSLRLADYGTCSVP